MAQAFLKDCLLLKIRHSPKYVMHPSISLFVHERESKVEDDCVVMSHNKLFDESKFWAYGFYDITDVAEVRETGKTFVECATVIAVLNNLCEGIFYSYVILFTIIVFSSLTFYHWVFIYINISFYYDYIMIFSYVIIYSPNFLLFQVWQKKMQSLRLL